MHKEIIIQFTILLHSDITDKSWEITRTSYVINDYLNELFKVGLLFNISPLPKIQFTSDAYLGTYTALLNDYLHKFSYNESIINNINTRLFFEFDEHHIMPSSLLSDSNYQKEHLTLSPLSKPNSKIMDVLYSSYENFLYVAICFEPQSFLSKLFFSTSSDDQFQGQVNIYNIVHSNSHSHNDDHLFHIERIDNIKLYSRPLKLHYVLMENNEFNLLFVATEEGSIEIYHTYNNFNLYLSRTLTECIGNIKISANAIIDFSVDKNSGYLYSISQNEKCVTISEFNYQKIIKTIPTQFIIDQFCFDNDNHKILLSDSYGNIYIYHIDNLTDLTLLQAIYNNNKTIQSNERRSLSIGKIHLDTDRNFMFVSSNRQVAFYDFVEKDNFQFESYKRLTITTMNNSKVLDMKYRNVKGELIIANCNGYIEFWSHDIKEAVYSFKAHQGRINKIIFDQMKGMLFTIGDGKIILWTLPDRWTSEEIRRDSLKGSMSIFENATQNKNNMMLLKNVFARMSFGSFRRSCSGDNMGNKKESEKCLTITNDSTNRNTVANANDEEDDGDNDLDGWNDRYIDHKMI